MIVYFSLSNFLIGTFADRLFPNGLACLIIFSFFFFLLFLNFKTQITLTSVKSDQRYSQGIINYHRDLSRTQSNIAYHDIFADNKRLCGLTVIKLHFALSPFRHFQSNLNFDGISIAMWVNFQKGIFLFFKKTKNHINVLRPLSELQIKIIFRQMTTISTNLYYKSNYNKHHRYLHAQDETSRKRDARSSILIK